MKKKYMLKICRQYIYKTQQQYLMIYRRLVFGDIIAHRKEMNEWNLHIVIVCWLWKCYWINKRIHRHTYVLSHLRMRVSRWLRYWLLVYPGGVFNCLPAVYLSATYPDDNNELIKMFVCCIYNVITYVCVRMFTRQPTYSGFLYRIYL